MQKRDALLELLKSSCDFLLLFFSPRSMIKSENKFRISMFLYYQTESLYI